MNICLRKFSYDGNGQKIQNIRKCKFVFPSFKGIKKIINHISNSGRYVCIKILQVKVIQLKGANSYLTSLHHTKRMSLHHTKRMSLHHTKRMSLHHTKRMSLHHTKRMSLHHTKRINKQESNIYVSTYLAKAILNSVF